jgi:hypothetical protein
VQRLLSIFVILVAMFGFASSSRADECAAFDQDHAAWDALLSRYVAHGLVDYGAWKRDGTASLEAYVAALGQVSAPCFAAFTRAQQLAFLIDAYNANTVRLVLDNYPLTSIRKIGLLPGAAFRSDFITLPAAGPGEISLDAIEHGTLRKKYQEPRIHFALVCAARSCPALRSEAYRAATLDAQLDDQGRIFLGDPSKNRFDANGGTLLLSRIFEWFDQDFVKAAGSVAAFVAPYLSASAAEAARDRSVKIDFLDYDWSLNGR